MKSLLSALLLLPALQAAAQPLQLPPVLNSDEPQAMLRPDLKAAGVRRFTQIQFFSGQGGSLDTGIVQLFTLDAAGRITEWTEYLYHSATDLRTPKPPAARLNPNIQRALQIRYAFDATGNLIAVSEFAGLAGHSDDAFERALMHKEERGRGLKRAREFSRNYAAHKKRIERFVDSLQAQGPPDLWYPLREQQLRYGADGRLLRISEPTSGRETRFSYEEDAEGRIVRKRSVFSLLPHPDDSAVSGSTDVHFEYTPDGKPSLIEHYKAYYDTGNIRNAEHFRSRQVFHYNAAGKPDTIRTREGYQAETAEVVSYEKGLRGATVWLSEKGDTIKNIRYLYKDTLLISEDQVFFEGRRRSRLGTRTSRYDARNLPLEHLDVWQSTDYMESVDEWLTLYFYGNAADDSRTAARPGAEVAAFAARREAAKAGEERKRQLRRAEQARREADEMTRRNRNMLREPGATGIDLGIAPDGNVEAAPAPTVFKFVEQMPKFNGDLDGYTAAKLRRPEGLPKDSIARRSLVQFIVNENGSLSGIETVRSSGRPELDAAARSFVSKMPPWIPGKQQGKTVRVYVTLPIVFRD